LRIILFILENRTGEGRVAFSASKEEIMATELDLAIDGIKERLGKLREFL